ncbi:hypothetical protein [Streptomyces sp. NPDC002825]|uniref:hypothetical protein n=1 Tax=Streptomyces sp. NPDC002825 TaxID=3154666 RepID=UPI0033196F91
MTDVARVRPWVAGGMAVAVIAVVVGFGYDILTDLRGGGRSPLHVSDVEGVWIAAEDDGARLVVRGDGSAELTREAQADLCGGAPRPEPRAIPATWNFGDSDDPRLMNLEVRDPDSADPCCFDLTVDGSGARARVSGVSVGAGSISAFVRGDAPV